MNIVKLHFHSAFLNTLYKLFLPGGKEIYSRFKQIVAF